MVLPYQCDIKLSYPGIVLLYHTILGNAIFWSQNDIFWHFNDMGGWLPAGGRIGVFGHVHILINWKHGPKRHYPVKLSHCFHHFCFHCFHTCVVDFHLDAKPFYLRLWYSMISFRTMLAIFWKMHMSKSIKWFFFYWLCLILGLVHFSNKKLSKRSYQHQSLANHTAKRTYEYFLSLLMDGYSCELSCLEQNYVLMW